MAFTEVGTHLAVAVADFATLSARDVGPASARHRFARGARHLAAAFAVHLAGQQADPAQLRAAIAGYTAALAHTGSGATAASAAAATGVARRRVRELAGYVPYSMQREVDPIVELVLAAAVLDVAFDSTDAGVLGRAYPLLISGDRARWVTELEAVRASVTETLTAPAAVVAGSGAGVVAAVTVPAALWPGGQPVAVLPMLLDAAAGGSHLVEDTGTGSLLLIHATQASVSAAVAAGVDVTVVGRVDPGSHARCAAAARLCAEGGALEDPVRAWQVAGQVVDPIVDEVSTAHSSSSRSRLSALHGRQAGSRFAALL